MLRNNALRRNLFFAVICAGLATLFPSFAFGQNPEDLLEKGSSFFQREKHDSAQIAYHQAFHSGDPSTQLLALSGLVKLAITQSRMDEADSLIEVGDSLKRHHRISREAFCIFGVALGEYFRKNSQFQKALTAQKDVLSKAQLITDNRLPYAEALFYTALTYERMDAYDSSVVYAARAYEVYKEFIDTTDLRFSNIYNGMGACYYRANQLEKAKSYYLLAKSIADQNLMGFSSHAAYSLINLSGIYRAEKNYEEAIRATSEALKIFRHHQDESGMAMAYYGLGVYHYFLGDYGQAKSCMMACIDIRERLFHEDHYSLIGPFEVLGIIYEEFGDYEKKPPHARKSMEKDCCQLR